MRTEQKRGDDAWKIKITKKGQKGLKRQGTCGIIFIFNLNRLIGG